MARPTKIFGGHLDETDNGGVGWRSDGTTDRGILGGRSDGSTDGMEWKGRKNPPTNGMGNGKGTDGVKEDGG